MLKMVHAFSRIIRNPLAIGAQESQWHLKSKDIDRLALTNALSLLQKAPPPSQPIGDYKADLVKKVLSHVQIWQKQQLPSQTMTAGWAIDGVMAALDASAQYLDAHPDQAFASLKADPAADQRPPSPFGAIVTAPDTANGQESSRIVYLRRQPIFQGSEYACYLGLDLDKLAQTLGDKPTLEQVLPCLVVVKKTLVPEKFPSKITDRFRNLSASLKPAFDAYAGNTRLVGINPSQKKTKKTGITISRGLLIQPLLPSGSMDVELINRLSSGDCKVDQALATGLEMVSAATKLIVRGHHDGIVFGDLKLANLALTLTGHAIVCDSGCIQGYNGMLLQPMFYTKAYITPQVDKIIASGSTSTSQSESLQNLSTSSQNMVRTATWQRSDLTALGVIKMEVFIRCLELHTTNNNLEAQYIGAFDRNKPFRTLLQNRLDLAIAIKNQGIERLNTYKQEGWISELTYQTARSELESIPILVDADSHPELTYTEKGLTSLAKSEGFTDFHDARS